MQITLLFLFAIFRLVAAAEAPKPDTAYFKNTYEECDKDFTQQFFRIKKNFPKAEIHEFQYSEGRIKSYFFPAAKEQKNLLVMISGIHGIEGFTGSAVQRWLLDQKINTEKTAILMVHGFNLYGFKNFRRVNENNIDLNRNFVLARAQFTQQDEAYAKLNTFLNPEHKADLNFLSPSIFIFKSLINIAKYSLESLRSSILRGQYTFPKGIFYGGDKTQIQHILLSDLVQTFMKPYKKIFLVDLHTGYGERGRLHLLTGKAAHPNSARLLKIFNADEIDFADKKKFYQVEGEMLSYFTNKIRLAVDAEITSVTFEYGTLDSQKTLGSIESLRRVILENQNHHYRSSEQTEQKIKTLYREMFYPSDQTWREAVLERTAEKMKKVFTYLE